MRYASIGGDVDPDLRPIEPRVSPVGGQPQVWGLAHKAAKPFRMTVAKEKLPVLISKPMRALAVENLAVAAVFVSPLLPADRSEVALGAKVEPVGRRRARHR